MANVAAIIPQLSPLVRCWKCAPDYSGRAGIYKIRWALRDAADRRRIVPSGVTLLSMRHTVAAGCDIVIQIRLVIRQFVFTHLSPMPLMCQLFYEDVVNLGALRRLFIPVKRRLFGPGALCLKREREGGAFIGCHFGFYDRRDSCRN